MKQVRMPSEPGWYWFKPSWLAKQIPVEVIDCVGPNGRLHTILPGKSYYSPVKDRKDGVWGDRIPESAPIDGWRACDFCPNMIDLCICENCGKELCASHTCMIHEQSLSMNVEVQAVLCPTCRDMFCDQTVHLLRSFKKGLQ